MGRDKALLPFRGTTLAGHAAAAVKEAAGSVTLIGDPGRYAHLGYPVVPDAVPECGPLGGIVTALRGTPADWNLVVACDMPAVSAGFLKRLLDAAAGSTGRCLVPLLEPGRSQPLCAVYHRAVLPALEQALLDKVLKMQIVIEALQPTYWTPPDLGPFANVNTPEQWEAIRR